MKEDEGDKVDERGNISKAKDRKSYWVFSRICVLNQRSSLAIEWIIVQACLV